MQMVHHIEEKEDADRSQLIDIDVFKLTSGNATKQLRIRQQARKTSSNDKTADVILKKIATQEFQTEKKKCKFGNK